MTSTGIQGICLTAMSFQEFEKSMFGVLFCWVWVVWGFFDVFLFPQLQSQFLLSGGSA